MTWPTEQAREALWAVEGTHHFHGDTCTCGFHSPVSRQRTEHITEVTVLALAPVVRAERAAALREAADVLDELPSRRGQGVYGHERKHLDRQHVGIEIAADVIRARAEAEEAGR